jgi:Fur family transcriptional regulator, peroxide stress response regulator
MAIRGRQSEMELFRSKCKEHGMRVTHQKVMIYEALLGSLDHPSPEQIYEKLKKNVHGLSLDTVYRTLSVFHEMGLVDLVDGFGSARRFDPMLEKHHHFRCIKCGTIIDFTSDDYDKIEIPKDIARQCKVIKLQVTIEGLCKKCLKTRKQSNSQ